MTSASIFHFHPDTNGALTPDEELVRQILAGDASELATLMHRHNQWLYRVCRSIVLNAAEAEEALQDAYLRTYSQLARFRGDTTFVTWLTKLAIYEALTRRQPKTTMRPQLVTNEHSEPAQPDAVRLLERAIDSLPSNFRTTFVLSEVEGLSAEETAACLLLNHRTVETRLAGAKRLLKERLPAHVVNQPADQVFPFQGPRSAELVERVIDRITQRAG